MNITPKEELTLYILVLIVAIAGGWIGFIAGLGVQPV